LYGCGVLTLPAECSVTTFKVCVCPFFTLVDNEVPENFYSWRHFAAEMGSSFVASLNVKLFGGVFIVCVCVCVWRLVLWWSVCERGLPLFSVDDPRILFTIRPFAHCHSGSAVWIHSRLSATIPATAWSDGAPAPLVLQQAPQTLENYGIEGGLIWTNCFFLKFHL